jgi:hypothetical protein
MDTGYAFIDAYRTSHRSSKSKKKQQHFAQSIDHYE